MSDQQVKVTFEPSGRSVFVLGGTKMLEAASRAGLTVETPCGGSGTCGKCRLRITAGACDPTAAEKELLSDAELADGWRLACQTEICGATVAEIPESSLFASHQRIVTAAAPGEAEILPAVRKVYVELAPPAKGDAEAFVLFPAEPLGEFEVDEHLAAELPGILRSRQYKGTAVLADHVLIDFEAGDTTDRCCGVAFDIGTTTLVGSLVDLNTGEEKAVASRINPQVKFGDDVLSRIAYASKGPDNLQELRRCLADAIGEMVGELCEAGGVARENIYEATFAGNTTMQHLLCGLAVEQLGRVPFAPAREDALTLSAAEFGAGIHPRGKAYVFPVVGGFVGGDAVAGMLAGRLADADSPVLLVDIGTNGEIVLADGAGIWAASAAAGPAFEGARISCGMRATGGAIEKIVFNEDVELSVIGNVAPAGICGSGLVDLAAGLLDGGIVTPQGRLLPPNELPDSVSEPLVNRVRAGETGEVEFVLHDAGASALTITQRDVRELQLATAAIRAGIGILLARADIEPANLQCVLIAGGFGSFIRRNHAQRIGLLPRQIAHEKIHYVGNASLSGARWALLSSRIRERAERLAREVEHVQLSEDADFQTRFAEAIIFPPGE
ncbi:MAG: ASKHA domain-containing protein [Planctomycetota bacterium]|jgi:uncharacterized 2Fe-2S/4Fe-4S cluster protein (DUF4445 family)